MFGLFQNNTPPYAGNGQPIADSHRGVLGLFCGLFAAATPRYAMADIRVPTATGAVASAPVSSVVNEQAPITIEQTLEQGACGEVVPPACTVPLPFMIVVDRPQQ